MKKRERYSFHASAVLCVLLCLTLVPLNSRAECTTGLDGWQVLGKRYQRATPGFLDGVTFQWDYFMVHDEGFTGSIGFVVADPRQHLVGLMPSGGNAAISGKFLQSGTIAADYVNFGTDSWTGPGTQGYAASAQQREFHGEKGSLYAHVIPVADNESLILQGRTEQFQWDLAISQDWIERCDPAYRETFPAKTGYDVGNFALLPLQHWSVDMTWLRTRVRGSIRNLTDNITVAIDGHGYREQAWGPWAFNFSGWDFAVVSDNASKVQWALQTYHDSEVMDYLDVSFYDDNALKAERFSVAAGELGWYHTAWHYDGLARQCVPRDMTVIARNSRYTVEAVLDIGDDQTPMLSDLTPITAQYVIMCRFPVISGTIRRTDTQAVVATFIGQGGGEFSVARRTPGAAEQSAEECAIWGGRFSAPLPFGCTDSDEDGYGYAGGLECANPERDCNDNDASIHPDSRELFGNALDDDCDSKIDNNLMLVWKKLFRIMIFWSFIKDFFS